MSRVHAFKPAITPLREVLRWRCAGCGLKRRRVYPAPKSFAHFGVMRSFWMYQTPGSGVWTNRVVDCTGFRS